MSRGQALQRGAASPRSCSAHFEGDYNKNLSVKLPVADENGYTVPTPERISLRCSHFREQESVLSARKSGAFPLECSTGEARRFRH